MDSGHRLLAGPVPRAGQAYDGPPRVACVAPSCKRRLPSSLQALGALVVLALCAAGCGSSGQTTSTHHHATPPANQSAKEPALYMVLRITELPSGHLVLQAVFSSSNGERGAAASKLLALPCPRHQYRYSVELNEPNKREPETYEARILMGAAHLSAAIACGQPLPTSIGKTPLTLSVYGNGGNAGHGVKFAATGSRLPNGNLVGLFPTTVGETLCGGKYRLVAKLGSTHQLTFDYPFVLTDVKGAEKC